MPKYAKVENGQILHIVDLPFEIDRPDHILVPDGHEAWDDPALYHAPKGKLERKPTQAINAISAARQNHQKKQGEVQQLIAWARTMGFKG